MLCMSPTIRVKCISSEIAEQVVYITDFTTYISISGLQLGEVEDVAMTQIHAGRPSDSRDLLDQANISFVLAFRSSVKCCTCTTVLLVPFVLKCSLSLKSCPLAFTLIMLSLHTKQRMLYQNTSHLVRPVTHFLERTGYICSLFKSNLSFIMLNCTPYSPLSTPPPPKKQCVYN